jgi:hypothetical protein
LKTIWPAFLDLVVAGVEQGMKKEWYWEVQLGPKPEPGPIRTFASSGILAYLDQTVVHTGFLPFKDGLPPDCATPVDRRYRLFFECWRKARLKYRRAREEGRLLQETTALKELMQKVLDREAWEKLL